MNGQEILTSIAKHITKESISDEAIKAHLTHAHTMLLELHARALACHCECLGMNAENCFAVSLGKQPPYGDDSYLTTMKKWGLINEKGEPEI